MRILVTGADGYIGAVLGPRLLERGHDCVGLDTGFYRAGTLFEDHRLRPPVVAKDVRDVTERDLAGFDAVVHLAELSNDPLGALDPDLTHAINHAGSVALARTCRAAGVRRFVYASSCSLYGASGPAMREETSELDPQTAYARCKALVERDVSQLAGAEFAPVFLRNATAFGASPRQRFDLVLNNLAGWAFAHGEIVVTSDGSPWRPLVHVQDIAEAVVSALEAPREAVANEVFNVGSDAQNYTVADIARIVAQEFPGATLSFGPSGGDTRSYRVSFAKIRDRLPAFRCRWDARRGAAELHAVFRRIGLDARTFAAAPFTRLNELTRLRREGRLDGALRWTAREGRAGREDEAGRVGHVGREGQASAAPAALTSGQARSFSEIMDTGSGQAIPRAGSS